MATRTFNADSRRQTREDATVTIGGEQFKPAPQSTELRAQLRKLGTKQAEINHEAAQLGELTSAKKRERGAELDAAAEGVLYDMIAAMLVRGDEQHVDPAWLADRLAPQDAAPLIEFLNSESDRVDEDPT